MKDILLSDNPLAQRMESLESKLDRLSPEQRKEVEDFMDFLMYRSGNSHESPGTAPVSFYFCCVHFLVFKINTTKIRISFELPK